MAEKFKMPKRERFVWQVVGGFMFPLITLGPLLTLPWWKWMPIAWLAMWIGGAGLIRGFIDWVDSW